MRVAVLSACQTGLGAISNRECVQKLQRAFHLAGCRNVVSALWDVPDASTTLLMRHFYQELLENKREPLEALHRAQLYVYRHPVEAEERLRRPPLAYKDREKMKEEPKALPAVKKGQRARAAQWAGFTLSGDGR
jgi:CHAT domain-containing protein